LKQDKKGEKIMETKEAKVMKLTEKSTEVFNYVKSNEKVSVTELSTAVGRNTRSVNANITDLVKKGLATRVKEDVEGEEKPVTYVVLTAEGVAFTA